MAGKDAVFDGSAVEREAHVGAAVVDGGEGVVFGEDGDCVPAACDHCAAAFAEFVNSSCAQKTVSVLGHSAPPCDAEKSSNRPFPISNIVHPQSDTIYAAKEHSYEDHKRPRIRDCAA